MQHSTKPTLSRILHVPRRFSQEEWGGTEAVVTNLCKAQLQMGLRPEIHTSLALAPRPSEVWKDIPIRRYNYCYPFFGLSADELRRLDKKGGNLLSWPLYASLRQQKNVRIFHAHVTKRMGGSVLLAARKANRPCVITLHGNVFDVPKEEADDVTAAQTGHFEWGRPFGWYFRSRTLLEEADAIMCVGFSEYEKASDILGKSKVHFLANGVHPEQFQAPESARLKMRDSLGLNDQDFLFGCISRIDPQKNQILLVEAFAQMSRQRSNCHLLMSGPETNASYAAKLKTAIEESGLKARIHYLPPVAPETPEHSALFAALDCFVLPSRHEPFGIVVLEAWAAGKPVIAAKVGGLARLVTHDSTGLHFTAGDVDSLSHALETMLGNPDFRAQCAARAQVEIAERYTWKKVADHQESIYQQAEAKYS